MSGVHRLMSRVLDFAGLRRRASRLNAPTQYGYLNGLHFIVDCWNDRILVHPGADPDLKKWRVLTGFRHPHRIVFSGEHYLVADTDNHRVILVRSGQVVASITGFNNPTMAVMS